MQCSRRAANPSGLTATRRTPLELKRSGPAEGESVRSTGPCTTRFDRFFATRAQRRRAWSETNGSREYRGSFCHVSSRPPVVMLRRRVLAPVRLWFVPISLWSCNTPYASMVVSLKSPTHHTASVFVKCIVMCCSSVTLFQCVYILFLKGFRVKFYTSI